MKQEQINSSFNMRVWLITAGEFLPTDPNPGRPMRTGLLANYLADMGHKVLWWTSTFNHTEKVHRYPSNTSVDLSSTLRLKLLHSIGYGRNISFARLIDHWGIAQQFLIEANTEDRPDVIVCSLPTLEFCAAATQYGAKYKVPVIIDVRDLWPDIFLDLVPRGIASLWRLILTPLFRSAQLSCRRATAIIGPNQSFINWGLRNAERAATANDRVFGFAYPTAKPGDQEIVEAYRFWKGLGIEPNGDQFRVCFFGAISHQFDLETVINAARQLDSQGRRFQFIFCGKGDNLLTHKRQSEGCASVFFPGFVNEVQIWTLMRMAQVGLAPYRDTRNFAGHIPNKVVEYISAGLPVVSSLSGEFSDILRHQGCGLSYRGSSMEELVDCLNTLRDNNDLRRSMSEKAHRLFRESFTVEKVCSSMMEFLERGVRTQWNKSVQAGN